MRLPARILVNAASLGLFAWAAFEIAKADWHGAIASLSEFDARHLAIAALLIVTSFLVFSFYDYLAWRWQGGSRPNWKATLSVSFIATCVSMNIGISALSGSAIRAKLYGDQGFPLKTIALVYMRTVLLFLVGWVVWLGLAVWASSDSLNGQTGIPRALLGALGWTSLSLLFGYLFICYKGFSIRFGKFQLAAPHLAFALAHITVSGLDILTSAGVLHVLLASDQNSFFGSTAVFMIANTAGMASQVPGGLGVFEWTAMQLSNSSESQNLGALLAFRFLFFWAPLVLALPLALHSHSCRSASR